MSELQTKARFFKEFYDWEAEWIYRNHARFVCNHLKKLFAEVWNEYNSIAGQNRVRKYLQNLSLVSKIKKRACIFPIKWRSLVNSLINTDHKDRKYTHLKIIGWNIYLMPWEEWNRANCIYGMLYIHSIMELSETFFYSRFCLATVCKHWKRLVRRDRVLQNA